MSNTSAKCLLGITDKLMAFMSDPQSHKPFRCTTLIEITVYLFLTRTCRLFSKVEIMDRERIRLDSGLSYSWYLLFAQRNLYNTDDLNGKVVQIVKL